MSQPSIDSQSDPAGQELQEIYRRTTRFFLRPIVHLLDDPEVSEVLINGAGENRIYREKSGRLELEPNCGFATEAELLAVARNLAEFAGRDLNSSSCRMDARLPDGSRVNIVMPPVARNGTCISIRRFQPARMELKRLVASQSMSQAAMDFLVECVYEKKNILISGGTSSGKTSLLNALSLAIPEHERVIVIEDTHELNLRNPHTVYLEAQAARPGISEAITIRDLFVNSLRMRPDRIVVGEIRHSEALDLLQAMISGHAGCLATLHADSPDEALARMELLTMMSDLGVSTIVARRLIGLAVDIVIQVARHRSGFRGVMEIAEVRDDGSPNLSTKSIFRREVGESVGALEMIDNG